MYKNYRDCKNKCEHNYGKSNICSQCTYYIENEIEIKIDKELEKIEKNIALCECDFEGELFSFE